MKGHQIQKYKQKELRYLLSGIPLMVSLLLLIGLSTANASSKETSTIVTNWTGGGDGKDWHNVTNWDNGIPDLQKQAIINISSAEVMIDAAAIARSVQVLQGSLTIDASLTIDGSASATPTIGLYTGANGTTIVNYLGVTEVSNTNSDGINNIGSFINYGTIKVTNATFASIQESSDNSDFTNYGDITINSPGTRGLQISFDGSFINRGAIDIIQSDQAIWLREADTQLDNYGEITVQSPFGNGIQTTAPATGINPKIVNHPCGSITSSIPFSFEGGTVFINGGLVNYTSTSFSLGFPFSFLDTGYQYDPFQWLPNSSTTELSAAMDHTDFTADLDGDASSFCQGDSDDFPYGPCPSVLYVDVKQMGAAPDGLSWATAYPALQEAINVATICDGGLTEIWVAEGTYYPTQIHDADGDGDETRERTFYINKDMEIYGGFAGDETSLGQRDAMAHETILSGDFNQDDLATTAVADLSTHSSRMDNAFHVVIIDGTSANGNISAACLIDGFSIIGGHANAVQSNFNGKGGGLLNLGCGGAKISSPEIANCNFRQNAASGFGGAIFNGGETGIANPWISHCSFISNAAGQGGAIQNSGSDGVASPQILYCQFRYNLSLADGGAIDYYSPDGKSDVLIQNSVFFKNDAVQGEGGAIRINTENADSTFSIVGSTFTGNSAACCAQTISMSCNSANCALEIYNSIFWNANAMSLHNTTTTIKNSVFHDGVENDFIILPSGATGTNNIDRNPQFIDAISGDLRLRSLSPAIDAGLTPAVPAHLTTDLQGEMRIHNGRVDIGAYERSGCGQGTIVLGSPDDDIAMDAKSIITTGEIRASNFISDNAEVIYNAEDGVILEDDFSVDQSAELEISQEGCDTTSLIYNKGIQGYIGSVAEGNTIAPGYTAGLGFYAAVWTLTPEPIHPFQIGLPSTWITPDNNDNTTEPLCPVGTFARDNWPERGPTYDYVFQTIEGGLGYWANQKFYYGPPKFMMNSVPSCYSIEVATPGWRFFGHDEPLPDDELGIAQLSNRILIPPDGITFDGNPNGEFLGSSYMALPLSQAHNDGYPTGINNWTLFFNAANFRGPVAYFVPEMYSKISENHEFIEGRGLDSRMTRYGGGATMEINTVQSMVEEDLGGISYSKIPQLQFPVDSEGKTTLARDWAYYSKEALYNQVLAWRDNGFSSGSRPSGQFDLSTTGIQFPTNTTYPVPYRQDEIPINGLGEIATNTIHNDNSFGFTWDMNHVDNGIGKFPTYFKELNGEKIPIAESELPPDIDLSNQEFNDPWPYPTPYEAPLQGAWANPHQGPYYAELRDSSVVTYYWYKFIDQPVFKQFNWTQSEKDQLQKLAEQIHEHWTIDKSYMHPISGGKDLVSFDPGVIVTPPSGLEKGYVPIVTKQSSFMDADGDGDGYSIATDSDDDDPNVH